MRGRSSVLLAVVCSSIACSSSKSDPSTNDASVCTKVAAPIDWPSSIARSIDALTADGFVVQKGVLRFFRVDDCKDLDNCFGNNPSSPYGFYCLPPSPGSNPVASLVDKICPDGLKPTWTMREDEAIVFLGRTAPNARYLGFRSYLFSRLEASGSRKDLFASLGDSINQLTIQTSGTACGGKGSAFDADVAIVTTADRALDQKLRGTLDHAGIPSSIVNSDAVPRALVKMGTGSSVGDDADALAMLYRVALIQDASAGEKYLQGDQVTVL